MGKPHDIMYSESSQCWQAKAAASPHSQAASSCISLSPVVSTEIKHLCLAWEMCSRKTENQPPSANGYRSL